MIHVMYFIMILDSDWKCVSREDRLKAKSAGKILCAEMCVAEREILKNKTCAPAPVFHVSRQQRSIIIHQKVYFHHSDTLNLNGLITFRTQIEDTFR